MVKLLTLPDQAIIDGFKGKIDYYDFLGTTCVRKWPRSPGHNRSPAVKAQWPIFTAAVKGWPLLTDKIQSDYRRWAAASSLSGRDLFIKGYISGLYRYPKELCMNPSFVAFLSADIFNLVNGVWTLLPFNLEVFDIGGNFDCVNNQFIAPRNGRYYFHCKVKLYNTVAGTHGLIGIANNLGQWRNNIKQIPAAGGWYTVDVSCIFNLSAGDTVQAHFMAWDATNSMDIDGLTGASYTSFEGSIL